MAINTYHKQLVNPCFWYAANLAPARVTGLRGFSIKVICRRAKNAEKEKRTMANGKKR